MNEFIEECRKEWRRLGVPDHIANEMATDLKADIDEAESEGGSAEDVLGNSLFNPRQFAAAWADSRGVSAPPVTVPTVTATVPATQGDPGSAPGRSWPRRVALPAALAFLAMALVVGGLALAVGGRSSSVALSVRRILRPGAYHLFRPRLLPLTDLSGATALVGTLMVLVGVIALAIAILSWAPWTRRQSS